MQDCLSLAQSGATAITQIKEEATSLSEAQAQDETETQQETEG